MQYIGKISYSLYLWHWPLFVIPAIIVGHSLSWAVRITEFFYSEDYRSTDGIDFLKNCGVKIEKISTDDK